MAAIGVGAALADVEVGPDREMIGEFQSFGQVQAQLLLEIEDAGVIGELGEAEPSIEEDVVRLLRAVSAWWWAGRRYNN